MTKYFGTDGVRGIANKELSPEMAFRLGRTGGYVLTQHKEDASRRPLVLVARDTRISGQMLADALIAVYCRSELKCWISVLLPHRLWLI